MAHVQDTLRPASTGLTEDLPWLRRIAVQLVGEIHADDLVQETWLLVASSDSEVEQRRPWLRRVLRNRAAMSWRSTMRRERREFGAASAPRVEDGESRAELAEVMAVLRDQIAALTHKERELLDLRVSGLTAHEVGEHLGTSEAAARTRIHRAIDKLRRGMDRHCGGRRGWLPALAAIPSPAGTTSAPCESYTAIPKFLSIALALLTAAALVVFAVTDDPELERPPAEVNTRNVAAAAPPTAPLEVERATARARWQERLDAIREARGKRVEGQAHLDTCGSREELPASELQEYLRPLLNRLKEDMVACQHLLREEPVGRMNLDGVVIGEPGVGAIVESLEALDVDERYAEFAECIVESMHTLEFPVPPRCLRHDYGFVLNLERGNVGLRLGRRRDDGDRKEVEEERDGAAPHPTDQTLLEIAEVLDREGVDKAHAILRKRGFTEATYGKWTSADGEVEFEVSRDHFMRSRPP